MTSLVDDTLVQHLIRYVQGQRPDDLTLRGRYGRLVMMVLAHSPGLDKAIRQNPQNHTAALGDLLRTLEDSDTEVRKVLRALAGQKFSAQEAPLSITPPTVTPVTPFKLQLSERVDQMLELRVVDSSEGEARELSHLPYAPLLLAGVLKILQGIPHIIGNYHPEQTDALRQMGMLIGDDIAPNVHERIGQDLYEAIMVRDVAKSFHAAVGSSSPGMPLPLHLRFDKDAAHVARFPWELLYYHTHLVADGTVDLIRYLSYPKRPQPSLTLRSPLKVLYIESRPVDCPDLPVGEEQAIVCSQLRSVAGVQVDVLTPPTYDTLVNALRTESYQIIHFDGHGSFDRRCPWCEERNYPQYEQCQNTHCQRSLTQVPPRGFLAFELSRTVRRAHWIQSDVLGTLLSNTQVMLVVLSACESSTVRNPSIVDGVAPALIQAGISAVVAMQLPVAAHTTRAFMRSLYASIVHGASIGQGVLWGRKELLPEGTWYIPTLYVRTR